MRKCPGCQTPFVKELGVSLDAYSLIVCAWISNILPLKSIYQCNKIVVRSRSMNSGTSIHSFVVIIVSVRTFGAARYPAISVVKSSPWHNHMNISNVIPMFCRA